jgi:hypothetical protein
VQKLEKQMRDYASLTDRLNIALKDRDTYQAENIRLKEDNARLSEDLLAAVRRAVLCCVILCCVILCCAVLFFTLLYCCNCTVVVATVLHCFAVVSCCVVLCVVLSCCHVSYRLAVSRRLTSPCVLPSVLLRAASRR